MPDSPEDIEPYLATTMELLVAEGMSAAATVLRTAAARIEESGYDNWNGGTTLWTVYLSLPATTYAKLGDKREGIEEQITKRLQTVMQDRAQDWYGVRITPVIQSNPDWRLRRDELSRDVRRNIIDGLKIDDVTWAGRLEEVEFLARIFDLSSMPSEDSRFSDAAGDIWQHRVNNPTDWPDDWIYGDKRFNLIDGPQDTFLRFLCEMVHPVVRPDRDESLRLVQQFNDQLRLEGWSLIEEEKIAGRPRFTARELGVNGGRSVSRARSVADALDAGWMQQEIERLENAVDRDPALAIGTAKDLVESCCKTILKRRNVPFNSSAGLPDLTKALARELKLVPEGISQEAKGADTVRLILRNLSSLTQYLAELRGLYGSGHGRDGKHRGLEPRHARLAVASAVAFIDFVTETHHSRPIETIASAKAE